MVAAVVEMAKKTNYYGLMIQEAIDRALELADECSYSLLLKAFVATWVKINENKYYCFIDKWKLQS